MIVLTPFVTYDHSTREFSIVDILQSARRLLEITINEMEDGPAGVYAMLQDLKTNLEEHPPTINHIYWMQRLQNIVKTINLGNSGLLPVQIHVVRKPTLSERLAVVAINEGARYNFVEFIEVIS